MFWETIVENSSISDILAKEDIKLEEILDHDSILQECRIRNDRLIEYLTNPDIFKNLVKYVVYTPPEKLAEDTRFKYPSLACEILTSDIYQFHDMLINGISFTDGETHKSFVSLFFLNIETKTDINPLIMSYCLRIITVLLKYKNEEVLNQIKSVKNGMDNLIRYVNLNAITTFFEEFISSSKDDDLRDQWLLENEFVDKIVKRIGENNEDNNAVENILSNIITLINDENVNKIMKLALINMFESKKFLDTLFVDNISNSNAKPNQIGSSLTLVYRLIETKNNDGSNPFLNCQNYIKENFNTIKILLDDSEESIFYITSTIGKIQPVGKVRIEILKLLKSVITLNNVDIIKIICESKILDNIINQLTTFKWNSLFHLAVFDVLYSIFSDINDAKYILVSYLINDYNIYQWYKQRIDELIISTIRLGYSGVIWKIGCLLDALYDSEIGEKEIKNNPSLVKLWTEIRDIYLIKTNKLNEINEVIVTTKQFDMKLSDLNDDDNEENIDNTNDIEGYFYKTNKGNDSEMFSDNSKFRTSSPKKNPISCDYDDDNIDQKRCSIGSNDEWVENVLDLPDIPTDFSLDSAGAHKASDDELSSDSDDEDGHVPLTIIHQKNSGTAAKYIMSDSSEKSLSPFPDIPTSNSPKLDDDPWASCEQATNVDGAVSFPTDEWK